MNYVYPCLERDSRLDESAMNGNDSWEELMGMGRLNERSEGSKQGRFIVLLSCYLVVLREREGERERERREEREREREREREERNIPKP